MNTRRVIALALGLALAGMAAHAQPVTDAQVREEIIRQTIANFHGACPCPYSKIKDRKGRWVTCGEHSEYFRDGTAMRCYPKDVSDTEVAAWRNDHGL
jgi:hypothetical protein